MNQQIKMMTYFLSQFGKRKKNKSTIYECILLIFMLWRLTQIELIFAVLDRTFHLINCGHILTCSLFDTLRIWFFNNYETPFNSALNYTNIQMHFHIRVLKLCILTVRLKRDVLIEPRLCIYTWYWSLKWKLFRLSRI